MCNDTKKSKIVTAKENLTQTKNRLEKTLSKGDETLCEIIKHILVGGNANFTSTDGKK